MVNDHNSEHRHEPTSPSARGSKGVMGRTYGEERGTRPELIFRYRYRALAAATAYRQWHVGCGQPQILDLGAADGATLREVHVLLNAAFSLGIEQAEELIQMAEHLPDSCELRQGDANNLAEIVDGRMFDVVLALAVLEHVPNPGHVLNEVKEVLNPGGLFIATCPSGTWDRISGWLGLHREKHHETVIGRRSFQRFATNAGLQFREYRRFMWAPIAVLPYFRLRVSPRFCQRCDDLIRSAVVLNFAFVNQLFVAQNVDTNAA